MKRVVAAILIIAFGLAGCSGTTGAVNMPVSPTEQVKISVTNYYNFLSKNEYSYYYDKDTRAAWIDYMSLHNDTDFTLYTDQIGKSTQLITNGQREGLVLLDSPLKIKELAHDGKILPLDDYLSKNTSWLALPEDFRNTFKIDGKIYALPFAVGNLIDGGLTLDGEMAINTKWLAQLGLEMPKTLDDLENVGKQFAKNDMNGDGIVGNDYLLGFLNPTSNIQIMQAFGLYCGYTTNSTYGYDPELGCIADSFFKTDTETALTYMKQLYADGVIDPASAQYYNYSGIGKDLVTGKYGTIFATNASVLLEAGLTYAAENYERITGKTYDPMSKEVLQWAAEVFEPIPPLSTQHPVTYSNTPYGYVMTAQTPMPNQVINRFVDLCYGMNSTTYLECNFGNGAYTLQSDGTCVAAAYNPLYGISIGSSNNIACPNLGGYYQNSLGENFVVTSGKINGADYAKALADTEDKITAYIDKYKALNLMVEVPSYYTPSGKAYQESAEVLGRNVYGALCRTLLMGSGTISDALKTYREDAVFYGMTDVLKESNNALGLPNKQKLQ